jgi:redox-sensitive bicupin YhaK (pirin superfamily)
VIEIYKISDMLFDNQEWGSQVDIFFASKTEKFLRFGDIISFSSLKLSGRNYHEGMKLYRNTEFINIVLQGTVGYQDSFGIVSLFPGNTVQVVSTGTGMYQMEFNPADSLLHKIQIGILPSVINSTPVQTKAVFNLEENINSFVEIVSPNRSTSSLSVRQDIAVLLGKFESNRHLGYRVNNNQIGLFVYVVEGSILVKDKTITAGEAIGISDAEEIMIHTYAESIILVIETIVTSERENNSENVYGRN